MNNQPTAKVPPIPAAIQVLEGIKDEFVKMKRNRLLSEVASKDALTIANLKKDLARAISRAPSTCGESMAAANTTVAYNAKTLDVVWTTEINDRLKQVGSSLRKLGCSLLR